MVHRDYALKEVWRNEEKMWYQNGRYAYFMQIKGNLAGTGYAILVGYANLAGFLNVVLEFPVFCQLRRDITVFVYGMAAVHVSWTRPLEWLHTVCTEIRFSFLRFQIGIERSSKKNVMRNTTKKTIPVD